MTPSLTLFCPGRPGTQLLSPPASPGSGVRWACQLWAAFSAKMGMGIAAKCCWPSFAYIGRMAAVATQHLLFLTVSLAGNRCSGPVTAKSDCANQHCCCSQRALPADAQRSLTRQMSQLHSPSVGGQGVSAGQPIDLTADDSPTSDRTPLLPVIEDRAPLLGISAGWQNGSAAGRQEGPGQAAVAAQVQVEACSVWLCWSGLSVGRSVNCVASRGWGGSGSLGAKGCMLTLPVLAGPHCEQDSDAGGDSNGSSAVPIPPLILLLPGLQVQIKQEGLSTQAGVAAVKLESVVPGQARGQALRGPLPVGQPARCHCQSPCLQPHSCCCPACVLPYGCA